MHGNAGRAERPLNENPAPLAICGWQEGPKVSAKLVFFGEKHKKETEHS